MWKRRQAGWEQMRGGWKLAGSSTRAASCRCGAAAVPVYAGRDGISVVVQSGGAASFVELSRPTLLCGWDAACSPTERRAVTNEAGTSGVDAQKGGAASTCLVV